MLVIPGRKCHTCEGPTRRELLRAGSIGLLGLNLADFLAWQGTARAGTKLEGSRGFGSAKSVIMVFLQGGPSHIDIWDPKPDAPANIRGEFKPIKTKIPGTHIGEHMPMMANALDKATLIRSMSYTPNGLFNHTAAIYQMLTGYPPDRVSPSGQGFVLYQTSKREVTSVAVSANGEIYAAASGNKIAPAPVLNVPTPPPFAAPLVAAAGNPAPSASTVPVAPPPSFAPFGGIGAVSGGSDVYRIGRDCAPRKLWSNA